MTALVHCLWVWRHYLLDQHFTIYIDNVGDNYGIGYSKRHMMCPLLDTRGNRGH
ncbi:unnamed protein product [Spirodela intermedia]|uniref:Uncharacterized protein n=1 Tax=Spirodela intermedia TaxID=51605 RepID=A0A7I8LA07_SPIIN|nr:unnamed protein product [Spirodela intermedia]